jgi:hypothetical protein
MRFELLLGLALTFLCHAVAATELPPLVLPLGVGVNIHFTQGHARDLDMMAAAGVKFVRMDFGWAGIERVKGTYDWAGYDDLTANLEKRGLSAIYIFDYSNPLYEASVTSKNPINGTEQQDTASPQHRESIAAFARWAAASADHFRTKSIIWEIWNEPNITFWKPKPDVEQYTALAIATCKAVHEAVPEAKIIGPATSGLPLDFLESFLKSGVLEDLSAVSVHPYRSYSKAPETVLVDYAKVRTLIDRYAPAGKPQIPIVSGEWGYASHRKGVSDEMQAAFLVRQQLVNLSAGIPISIWYDWKNDGLDAAEREHNFGTVTYDLQPKPAYRALQTLTRELGGFAVARRLKTESEQDYILLCTNRVGEAKLAVWTTNPTNSVSLFATESIHPLNVVDSSGANSPIRKHQAGIVLSLGPVPAYVALARPGPAK